MKINIFVPTNDGGNFTGPIPYYSITGQVHDTPQSPEDDVINAIDESRMSPQKALVERFKVFLGNRRLKIADLKNLSKDEQNRIRKEFLDGESTTSSALGKKTNHK